MVLGLTTRAIWSYSCALGDVFGQIFDFGIRIGHWTGFDGIFEACLESCDLLYFCCDEEEMETAMYDDADDDV